MKLAVFLPNWIGDAVMATPTLRALRNHLGPAAEIIGVMRPYVADVLAGTNWIDESWYYAPRSNARELSSLALAKRLRQKKLDAVVMLTNSLRTGLLARVSGAPQRVGYVRYGRSMLLTDRLYPPVDETGERVRHPMVDYYLELAYAMGCPRESHQLELATTREDQQAANLVWEQLGLSQRVVVFNSSGAFGAAKLWPTEYFAMLARRVVTELNHDVLVLCGPQERDIANNIVQQAGHSRVKSLAKHPLSIGLSKACVERSQMMVTTDSGPRHFAVAFGVPVIGLFGPTPSIWGENVTATALDMQTDLDCLGCHKRVCPLGHHRCMRDLNPDSVFQAMTRFFERRQGAAA